MTTEELRRMLRRKMKRRDTRREPMSGERLVIKSITRKGWLWWSVRWELVRANGQSFTGGSIDGAPWYVLRRLEEWLEP